MREVKPEPEVRALWSMPSDAWESSTLRAPYIEALGGRGNDYDFDFSLPGVKAFAECYEISMEWIESMFRPSEAQIIPIYFRSDYCLTCMEESVTATGFPVYLKSWRYLLKPFCQVHGCVLRSAGNYLHDSVDFAMDVFEYDSARGHELERETKWLEKDREVQLLARMVVERADKLIKGSHDQVVQRNAEHFLLTLLRLALTAEIVGDYTSVLKFRVQSSSEFDNVSGIALFHQLPLRVTAIARARAFYLVGLLLGWITDEQAADARPDHDFYLSTSGSSLWRRINLSQGLRTMLQLYSTDFLGVSSLKGWK
ncbi:hypothetical protein [Pseudomonas palleroniana]|uniref:hypothetical protein n=1 Tax=Pseudomonas palleroniana TaxID=191390 RepID=UPI0018E6D7F0|nr:hypothetical protein [Pseudomonas palleroniana]MBI6908343.1 hypothetical protein [Pseudomonas palleroniana]